MSGLLGAVLAGGRSSRFGSDKAAALLEGCTLLHHASNQLRRHVDMVVIVGGERGVVADLPRPGLGPLAGIAAALDHGAAHGYRCVLTIGCDMPSIPDGLLAALLRRAPAFCDDAPVLGHWPSALGAQLLAHVEAGRDRSMRGWARAIGAVPIRSPVPLANINTRDDLDRLTCTTVATA